ncbi:MAG: DUF4082 domain-containing protein [Akkermansiaceae bacterium]|jgi:hypothetical protein|nr:DUF4082 domain-containing protein [Akkermansiaceae bacterium]
MKSPHTTATLALLPILFSGTTQAATVFTSGSEEANNTVLTAGVTMGYAITPTTNLQLNALGFWDAGSDGLPAAFQLGLWQSSTETLLASVTIDSTDALDASLTVEGGQWRYETLLSPITLTSGSTYTLGFFNPVEMSFSDYLFFNSFTITSDPAVSLSLERYAINTGSLSFPSFPFVSIDAYPGQVNAQFTVIPEPSATTLAALGTLALLKRRRRSI